MLWTEKYKPRKLEEVRGQDKALRELRRIVESNGIVLLHGPTGTGKTSSVHALANELDYEIVEVNASDFRNKEQIQKIVGSSAKQMSLFSKGKIILIDEVEGISGTKDRGGLQELGRLIENNAYPFVLTTTKPYEQKLSTTKRKCKLVEFEVLDRIVIFKRLKEICEKEKIEYEEKYLKSLARRSGGDLRGAISDLQSLCVDGKLLGEEAGEREREESITNALRLIFKSRSCKNVLRALDKTSIDLNESMLWIDENLPKEYSGEDLRKAYEALSKADVYNGRIRRWQHWRFLVYVNALLTAGISTAKKEKNSKVVSYRRTMRILKLWQAKIKYAKRLSIAEKIGMKTHISRKRAVQEMSYMKFIDEEIKEELGLEDEEYEWLRKTLYMPNL